MFVIILIPNDFCFWQLLLDLIFKMTLLGVVFFNLVTFHIFFGNYAQMNHNLWGSSGKSSFLDVFCWIWLLFAHLKKKNWSKYLIPANVNPMGHVKITLSTLLFHTALLSVCSSFYAHH